MPQRVVDEGVSVHLFSCDLLSATHQAGGQTQSLASQGLVWSGMDSNAMITVTTVQLRDLATAPLELTTGSLALSPCARR